MNPPGSIVAESCATEEGAGIERGEEKKEKSTGLKTRHYKIKERPASEGGPCKREEAGQEKGRGAGPLDGREDRRKRTGGCTETGPAAS